ncbi:hypothetical protein ACFQ0I_08595 [Mariniflexile aquimaris]|uniref:Uncharacterized protein n=1 Tax=Mariniflexile aquimaris TaxID=881009 RepID=A0ABW3BSE7_9FLAO
MKRYTLSLLLILLFTLDCFCQEYSGSSIKNTVVKNGIGLGSVIAVVISWEYNKSVLLAILHGVFGWFYVIFYVINRDSN